MRRIFIPFLCAISLVNTLANADIVKYETIDFEGAKIVLPFPDKFCRVKDKVTETERLELLIVDPLLIPLIVIEPCAKSIFSPFPWGYIALQPAKKIYGRELGDCNNDCLAQGQKEVLNADLKQFLNSDEASGFFQEKIKKATKKIGAKLNIEVELSEFELDKMVNAYSGEETAIYFMSLSAKASGASVPMEMTMSATLARPGNIWYYLYFKADSGKSFVPNTIMLKEVASALRELN